MDNTLVRILANRVLSNPNVLKQFATHFHLPYEECQEMVEIRGLPFQVVTVKLSTDTD